MGSRVLPLMKASLLGNVPDFAAQSNAQLWGPSTVPNGTFSLESGGGSGAVTPPSFDTGGVVPSALVTPSTGGARPREKSSGDRERPLRAERPPPEVRAARCGPLERC